MATSRGATPGAPGLVNRWDGCRAHGLTSKPWHPPADLTGFCLQVQMRQRVADEGHVVPLNEKVVMHREAVESARRAVLALFARKAGFETTEFRDALGVSRKFAVPLLDYFDTVRLTVRTGSRRTPGAEARRALEAKQKGG